MIKVMYIKHLPMLQMHFQDILLKLYEKYSTVADRHEIKPSIYLSTFVHTKDFMLKHDFCKYACLGVFYSYEEKSFNVCVCNYEGKRIQDRNMAFKALYNTIKVLNSVIHEG